VVQEAGEFAELGARSNLAGAKGICGVRPPRQYGSKRFDQRPDLLLFDDQGCQSPSACAYTSTPKDPHGELAARGRLVTIVTDVRAESSIVTYALGRPGRRPESRFSMDRKRFEKLVEQALARLPELFRSKLTNIAITVEDLPPREAEREDLLLGLFHGVPLTEKSTFQANLPDRIFLYQKNIEAVCSNDEEIRREIRATLLHELGHYFGLSEDELREV
jgi:predicted Zn-dependent protease with MMP-like domain